MIARLWLVVALSLGACAADDASLERGRAEEARACIACHSLRLVHSQRLSRTGWNKELDKMTGWGTSIKDREALLEYLVANFGADKPLPTPQTSLDGAPKPH